MLSEDRTYTVTAILHQGLGVFRSLTSYHTLPSSCSVVLLRMWQALESERLSFDLVKNGSQPEFDYSSVTIHNVFFYKSICQMHKICVHTHFKKVRTNTKQKSWYLSKREHVCHYICIRDLRGKLIFFFFCRTRSSCFFLESVGS